MRQAIGLAVATALLCGCTAVKQQPTAVTSPTPVKTEISVNPDPGSKPVQVLPVLSAIEVGKDVVEAPTLSDGTVEGEAFLEPLEGEGLAPLSETTYADVFHNLAVSEESRTYSFSDFQDLLPDRGTKVGELYSVEPTKFDKFLNQFHPRVMTTLDRDGVGAYGILIGQSGDRLEYALRVHAQFMIADDIILSPAQFDIRLVIDRKNDAVEYFSFALPTTHQKNVNFEAQLEDFLVGMVFTPRMELMGGTSPGEIGWTESVDPANARKRLAEEFFSFERIAWVPVDQAMEIAKREKKPIFAIVIEGVLNDQSC